uniref:Integrase, catalytic region, zinc finger, CCHC-type, peptidase aspartic, catalytic n=1 Tax=Tanacetum cinerariifolium TaxID=118510 RepID=A0A6L2LDK9_TANCI|nr:integrase, catalytic region, zinc finger, CCHC-type, peptidase aspartic, catalytic [Tanacetum cinerariifolium]
MTGDRSQLTNFVNKFLGTLKFRNDHVAKIMGYGDYHIGNVTILRVYYMEGLGHNLFSIGQLCDSNLEVAFRQPTCFIRNLEGVDLLTGSRGNNLYALSVRDMMASADNTSCPLLKEKKGFRTQPSTNDLETINSRLMQNIPSPTPIIPPSKNDWDSLSQPMFNKYFKPPQNVDHPVPEVPTPVPTSSTSSPSSTIIDQDAPSTNTSETSLEQQSLVILQEHLSDTKVFTMKMEILLVPTSYKLRDYIKMEMRIPHSSKVKFIVTCSYSRLNDFITLRKNDPKLSQTRISISSSDYIKMEMRIPHSSKVKFIVTCSYSRLNDFIALRKNDPKLSQTLISTSSSIIMANLPPPDHVADLPKDDPVHPEPALIILNHAPTQLEGFVSDDDMEEDEEEDSNEDPKEEPIEQLVPEPNNTDGFALHPLPQPKGNMNGWLIEDDDEDLEEDVVGDDDEEEMEVDEDDGENGRNDDEDKAEVINPYEKVNPLNRPPPTSNDDSEFAPPVVPAIDANNEPVPPVIQFGDNFHVGESSSTRTLLTGNGWVHAPGSMGYNLEIVHIGVMRLDR